MGDFRAGLVSGISGNEGTLLEALKSKDRSLRQLHRGAVVVGEIEIVFVFIESGIRFFLLRLLGR